MVIKKKIKEDLKKKQARARQNGETIEKIDNLSSTSIHQSSMCASVTQPLSPVSEQQLDKLDALSGETTLQSRKFIK